MNRLTLLGKRASLVIAMLAVLAGMGSSPAAASGAPASSQLFWGNWDDGIGHANLDGGAAEERFITSPGRLLNVAANDEHVYWSNQYGDIGRAKLNGSDAQPGLISGLQQPGGIALDDTYVYWVEGSMFIASIGRAKLDGTEVDRNFITGVDVSFEPTLAVDGQHIYWAAGWSGGSESISRADIDGTNVQNGYVQHAGGGSIEGIAVDATHIYWAYDRRDATGADLFRAPLGNTSAREPLVSSPTDGPMQIAVDDEYVYFSRYGPAGIGRVELDGDNPDFEFLSTGPDPWGLALAPAPSDTLASLTLAEGTLAPEFDPEVSDYELNVDGSVEDGHVTATLADPDASLTVNGAAATSGVPTRVYVHAGATVIPVVVTAQDGSTKTYKVTVYSPAELPHLFFAMPDIHTIGNRPLVSAHGFSGSFVETAAAAEYLAADDEHLYWSDTAGGKIVRSDLDGSHVTTFLSGVGAPTGLVVDERHIYWADDAGKHIGRANLDGTGVDQSFIANPISVSGPMRGMAIDDRHVYWGWGGRIGRAALDGGSVEPDFVIAGPLLVNIAVDGQHIYATHPMMNLISRTNLDGSGLTLLFHPVTGTPEGIAVHGQHVYWGNQAGVVSEMDLDGSNEHMVISSAPMYGLAVARLSDNAALSGLSAAEGSVSPGFDPAVTGYQLNVDHDVTSAHLTVTTADDDATVAASAGSLSGNTLTLPLHDGANVVTFTVTAQDGATAKAYTVTVTRALSDDATLSGLSVAEGALTPDFDPAATGYRLDVGTLVTSSHLTANVADGDATLAASAGSLSGTTLTLPLEIGENVVTFTVTAPDGHSTKTYTVTVTREVAPTLTVVTTPAKPGATKPEFTTNPVVQLITTAPAGSTHVEVSEDPGFGEARSFAVTADGIYSWTLAGDGEHTVYVRFLGAGPQPTLSATVELDTSAPTLTMARFFKSRNGRVWMRLAGIDRISGVARLQFALKRDRPLRLRSWVGKPSLRTTQRFVWVRAVDGAGNVSAWKKVVFPAKHGR